MPSGRPPCNSAARPRTVGRQGGVDDGVDGAVVLKVVWLDEEALLGAVVPPIKVVLQPVPQRVAARLGKQAVGAGGASGGLVKAAVGGVWLVKGAAALLGAVGRGVVIDAVAVAAGGMADAVVGCHVVVQVQVAQRLGPQGAQDVHQQRRFQQLLA